MKGKPIVELAGVGVIKSEEGGDGGVIEAQLINVGQIQRF